MSNGMKLENKLLTVVKLNGSTIMQPEIASKIVSHIKNITSMPKKTSQATREEFKEELSERETEILKLVAKGFNNRDIAKLLYISEGTVKNYISNIYSKLDISDRSKLILYAIEKKIT